MMNNTKWLRRALLGGVALSVMATGVQADELERLKGELEALQGRVHQLEQQPAMAALPEGASFITLTRGSADIQTHLHRSQVLRDEMPLDRGFTIAVTPTADLPAPVAEVVVYGFVKGDMIYDFDGIKSDTFWLPELHSNPHRGNDHFRAHAKQTRFGIRSRTDTAIGQIRSTVEGDFFSGADPSSLFRARHLFGEWDMTPRWTFLAGQTTRVLQPFIIGIAKVDFAGSPGPDSFARAMQVRLTYHSGPISWAVSAEKPSEQSHARWPNFSSYLLFDAPGGHQFIVNATVADRTGWRGRSEIGWAVAGGANINLADIATLTVGGIYGKHEHCTVLNQHLSCRGFATFPHDDGPVDFFSDRGWGFLAGLSFGLTDTTTLNVQYGLTELENDLSRGASRVTTQAIHGNILWQPVRQMRLGWEVMWGRQHFSGGNWRNRDTRKSDDAMRAQFGAWFFF